MDVQNMILVVEEGCGDYELYWCGEKTESADPFTLFQLLYHGLAGTIIIPCESEVCLDFASTWQTVVPLIPVPLRYLGGAKEIKERAKLRLMGYPRIHCILRRRAEGAKVSR